MDHKPRTSSRVQRQAKLPTFTPQPPVQSTIFTAQLQRQAQVAQQLTAHTVRPVAFQRQQASTVLEASSLQREVDESLSLRRQALETRLSEGQGSGGGIHPPLQRSTSGQTPLTPLTRPPASSADWVQAARLEVQRVADPAVPEQTRWLSGAERERHLGALKSVGHGLAQGFKADRGPAVQRYAEYGEHLATLQRQALTSSIPRMVLTQLSPTERPMLQRAVDEALQRQAEQDDQDAGALHLHSLQRQLAELDRQAEQPILERIQARRGSGAPLPAAVQRQLEVGLNHELSGVRVHTDTEADMLSKKVNAVAFTTGQDIYFRSGAFDPNSQTGIELLAHEATHVKQQGEGRVASGIDPDAGLEAEARRIGRQISRGAPQAGAVRPRQTVAPKPGSGLQRAPAQSAAAPRAASATSQARKPDPAEYARQLADLLRGKMQHVASDAVMSKLDGSGEGTLAHYRDRLLTSFGRGVTANLLAGTTRQLASRPAGTADRLQLYTLPMLDPAAVARLGSRLASLKTLGVLEPTLKAFETQYGKSLYSVLGERVRDPGLRARLLTHLPPPISEAQLTRDAFLENLAVNFVYSNQSARQMNTEAQPEERRGAKAGQLLEAFGYTAGEPLSGRWGLQMRIFTPISGKPGVKPSKDGARPVIVAFRGTEGVALDSKKNPEGAVDTMIGDFAKAQPGYNQFDANAAWIDKTIRAAARGGRVTMIGHSLGGALAQIAAARYPQLTGGVVVFQAANISQQDVARVEAYNKAHPERAVRSRSYRVDGDVVPTSGEATLPGQIYYFDRAGQATVQPKPVTPAPPASEHFWQRWERQGQGWVDDKKSGALAWAGGQLTANMPYLNAAAASKGHVVPMLATSIRGERQGPIDPQRQALLNFGQRDENELAHRISDGKGGFVTQPAQEHVQTVFSGSYSTARDPRLQGEPVRKTAVPSAMDLTQGYAGVFQDNIAYDTGLGHLFALASKAKDYKTFEQQVAQVLVKPSLELLPEDVALARQLHLDKSPRANATAALKNLIDFQRTDIDKATSGLSDRWPVHARTNTDRFLKSKYDDQMAKYSPAPVLNAYQAKGAPADAPFRITLPGRIRAQLADTTFIRQIWSLYHPGAQK